MNVPVPGPTVYINHDVSVPVPTACVNTPTVVPTTAPVTTTTAPVVPKTRPTAWRTKYLFTDKVSTIVALAKVKYAYKQMRAKYLALAAAERKEKK